MRKSRTVSVPVAKRYEAAYGLMREPENFPKWTPVLDGIFELAGNDGLDWRVDLPRGRRILRFSAPNDYGILDYTVLTEAGEVEHTARLRLLPNEEGSELVATYFQRPGQSDEQFASDVEWAASDLRALAAVVEQS